MRGMEPTPIRALLFCDGSEPRRATLYAVPRVGDTIACQASERSWVVRKVVFHAETYGPRIGWPEPDKLMELEQHVTITADPAP